MKFKIPDIFVILVAIIISTIIIIYPVKQGDSKRIELLVGSEIVVIPSSDKEYNFLEGFIDIQGNTHNIGRDILMTVKAGVVDVHVSSCKDKICVDMPPAKECGDIIICLPNQFGVLINCDKNP